MPPDPKPVIEYESIPRPSLGSWGPDLTLAAVVGITLGTNALVAVSQWSDYHPFGWFAVGWVAIGVLSLGARAAGCRWVSVLSSVSVSVLGFCVNAHYLGEITASI